MSSVSFPFQTVLVTGGAGFIGSRAVQRLRAKGVRVIAVDNGYVGLPLPAPADGLVPINADIRDADAMAAVLSQTKPDAILHLAAVHHIPTCEREPGLAFDVNVMGTQTLLDAAAQANVQNIVFASSGAVYHWDEGPLREGVTGTGATDVYSITKLANEYQIAGWAGRTGARAHMARLFNTIGSGDPNGHLIPDILSQIGAGDDSTTIKLGNTKPKRDYIYVDDVADGFVALLEGLGEGEQVEYFNLSTGEEMSVGELVMTIADLMGAQVSIENDPTRIRKIDRLQQLGDPSKLKSRRAWSPKWTARTALKQIIADSGIELPETEVA